VVEAAGLNGRCEMALGSYFEGVPSGGDVYVVKLALTDHTDEKCERILWNVRQPLASTGFPIWPSSGRAPIELHLTVA